LDKNRTPFCQNSSISNIGRRLKSGTEELSIIMTVYRWVGFC